MYQKSLNVHPLDEGGFWTLVRFKHEIWILEGWVCYVMAVIAALKDTDSTKSI